ncbi:MAG: NAD(P)/FAD-dependent oxidoreductase [Candidatus Marinimicrobia bacterium]|nr:NAD(P)/FAD-dependent oxidoreductase [Candidatus Neomarinimicrobiota bacterium]
MTETPYDIIVIGAGAAGLIAAGTAAEAGASVLLLESMKRAGRKLLITGKGRCNITNNSDIAEYMKQIYPVPKFCRPMFSRFFLPDTLRLFHRLNVPTLEERGRRIFPQSQHAMDVVDALVSWIEGRGVTIKYQRKVKNLLVENGAVKGVELDTGSVFPCRAVILATGGRSYPATGSTGDGYVMAAALGHRIVTPLPALVPLTTSGGLAPELQGLSLRNVRADLYLDGKKVRSNFGEMLFTHFGLSGPIILDISRDAVIALAEGRRVEIELDCKAALDETVLDARLLRELDANGRAKLKTMIKNLVPLKMVLPLCAHAGLDPEKFCNQVSGEERRSLLTGLKHLRFTVTGHTGWNDAIITSGGVDLKEVNPSTLESKRIQGLYFAGEILDLDAATGGYNLQIAWSSGFVAGTAAADAAGGQS